MRWSRSSGVEQRQSLQPARQCAGVGAAGDYLPSTSERSTLLEDAHLCALAAAVPLRHRWRRWRLLYATARDGISLGTLYRQARLNYWEHCLRGGPTRACVKLCLACGAWATCTQETQLCIDCTCAAYSVNCLHSLLHKAACAVQRELADATSQCASPALSHRRWRTARRRASEHRGPCVLVVRDRRGAVFGCFTAEAWRVAPRYYGTGESFVFQLQARLVGALRARVCPPSDPLAPPTALNGCDSSDPVALPTPHYPGRPGATPVRRKARSTLFQHVQAGNASSCAPISQECTLACMRPSHLDRERPG